MKMPTKRILHILHTLSPGGCEYMLLLLLPVLKERGWAVSVVTLGPGGPLKAAFEANGITVTSDFFSAWWDIAGFFRLRRFIQIQNPGLIIGHLFYADLLIRLLPKSFFGVPAVPLIHSTYRAPQLWKLRWFERLTAWSLTHCFLVSPAVYDTAIKYGLRQKVGSIIPNPVDTDLFVPVSANAKTVLRQKYGYPSDAQLITCVANFIDYKRHRDLLEAFFQISHTFPKLELILIGDGQEASTLRASVKDHQLETRVHFVGNYLGKRNSVAETLQLCDLFVLPSLFEGMCTAIMEAMATGIPVIASDIPENRVLIPDTSIGRLVSTQSPKALAQTIRELLVSPDECEAVGQNARTLVLKLYNPERIAQTWETVFTELTQ